MTNNDDNAPTPSAAIAIVLASCATLLILLVVALCLSSCTAQNLQWWEQEAQIVTDDYEQWSE